MFQTDAQRKKLMTVLTHALLISLSLIFIFPFLWLLDTAVKPIQETMKQPPVWIPSKFQFNNFWDAMKYGQDQVGYIPFLVYAQNTIMLCILTVCGTVVSNAIVAYSFARLRWKGRDFMFAITLATMMVPFPVLMVPTFAIFRHLDWIGTFRPLWVPAWFGSAFSIFLRQRRSMERASGVFFGRSFCLCVNRLWRSWPCSPSWEPGTTSLDL
jgi:multiple sugar transport system permease protein